jgi:transcriptional regulator with XRE-family HTH domain
VSRSTLSRLENGDPSVSFATVLRVLSIYGLDAELDSVAADDELGRRLQDAALKPPRRVSRRRRRAEHTDDQQ